MCDTNDIATSCQVYYHHVFSAVTAVLSCLTFSSPLPLSPSLHPKMLPYAAPLCLAVPVAKEAKVGKQQWLGKDYALQRV